MVVGSWVFLFWGWCGIDSYLHRLCWVPACVGVFGWYCGFVYVLWLVYCWWFRFGKCAGCRCLWVGLLVRCLVGCWLLWVVCCTLFCVFAFVYCASLVVASVWMCLVGLCAVSFFFVDVCCSVSCWFCLVVFGGCWCLAAWFGFVVGWLDW